MRNGSTYAFYAHMRNYSDASGSVEAGELIGYIDDTENAKRDPAPLRRIQHLPWIAMRGARSLAATAVLATAAMACAGNPSLAPRAGSEEVPEATQLSPAPPASESEAKDDPFVATAVVQEVEVFRTPEARRSFTSFEHPGAFGTPRVFLVREYADDWLRVLLPMRPNGSEGWVRADDVELARNPYRIEVDLSEFRLWVYKNDRTVLESSAAVGTGGTPTPTGLFFTTILAKPSDPASPYGKYAYGLSGYSEVLNTFAGGDGQIAIHGTNQPSLIGTAVSHGCIRVDNRIITKIARLIPLGTPVRIHS